MKIIYFLLPSKEINYPAIKIKLPFTSAPVNCLCVFRHNANQIVDYL